MTQTARENLPGYQEPGLRRQWMEPGKPIGHIRADDFERFVGRPLHTFKLVFATIRKPLELEWSKWNFWRGRYYRDGDRVAWRHPADEWCWQHSWPDYVQQAVEPFNEWYAEQVAPWSEKNYNQTGRLNWWLADGVRAVDITDRKAIEHILTEACKKPVSLPHLHKTGAPKVQRADGIERAVLAQYEGQP